MTGSQRSLKLQFRSGKRTRLACPFRRLAEMLLLFNQKVLGEGASAPRKKYVGLGICLQLAHVRSGHVFATTKQGAAISKSQFGVVSGLENAPLLDAALQIALRAGGRLRKSYFRYLSNHATVRSSRSIWFSGLR